VRTLASPPLGRWTRVGELRAAFVQGRAPDPPLDGRYDGRFLRTTINPILDVALAGIAYVYMGWLGKRFDSSLQDGDNRFDGGVLGLTRLLWPRYRGITSNDDGSFDAFEFHSWVGAGLLDLDTTVLKIDYDIPENPYSVRRVLDEVVQLPDGRLLGKAHLNTWWGDWTTVGYFALGPTRGVV
jgi:hypothetical protein